MTEGIYGVYETIINATGSELNIFFIILSIALLIVAIPLCRMVLKDRKEKRKGDADAEAVKHDKHLERESKFIERERLILDVIKENTIAISKLNVTLENNGEATKATLDRIRTRIDDINNRQTDVKTDVAKIKIKLENTLSNQIEMTSKINKILLIVDKLQ